MKIAIITQPLWDNYGGLLQNWALQQVLKRLGHDVVTVDLLIHRYPFFLRLNVGIKNIIKSIIPFMSFEKGKLERMNRSRHSEDFIKANIQTTERVDRYSDTLLDHYSVDCVLVGSDQVWRPRYNIFIYDMFLRFCKKKTYKKVAYACSLGVDCWEFTKRQTHKVKRLIRLFNHVSVREKSAVKLLYKNLGCLSSQVLDPTLLLTSEDYDILLNSNCEFCQKEYIAAYILNNSESTNKYLDKVSKENGDMEVKRFSADRKMSLSVPDWLQIIKGARFVITDSFHGVVFCLIFKKDFIVIENDSRGNSRFESLLSIVGLEDRIISQPNDFRKHDSVDWDNVELLLSKQRNISYEFIRQSLT